MKVFNKYFLLMSLSVLFFAACSDNDFEYTPASAVEGEGFYFSSDNSTSVSLSSLETSFDVVVGRTYSGTATTATITSTDESGLFNIPSSVSFAADELSTTLTITYDPDAVGYSTYSITLSLEETGQTTPYGASTLELTVGVPEPWVSLGNATFSDAFFFGGEYSVEIQQNQVSPNQFRLVDPHAEGLVAEGYIDSADDYESGNYLTFRILEPGDVINSTTVTMDDLVYFSAYNSGWYYEYYGADVYLYHPSAFTSYQDESYWTYSYVKSYQSNGLPAQVQLAPYYYMSGVGGWNYTQYDDVVVITFPGAVIADYSATVAYGGRFVSTSGENYAIATVTLGDDVASAKVALIKGKDVSGVADGIIDGSIESTEVTASGDVQFSCEESGTYTFVIVTFDSEGNAQETNTATFTYSVGVTETWTAIATGSYWYTLFFGSDSDPYEDAGLVLYQSDNDPTRYKIEHWGYDVDYCFTYDDSTGEVWVDDQEIGYEYGSYGMVYVVDYSTYVGDDEPTSYYDDDTNSFYFAQVYYVSAGYLTYGYEQFEITGVASAKSASKAKSSRKAFGEDLEAKKITPLWRLQKPKLNTLWNN